MAFELDRGIAVTALPDGGFAADLDGGWEVGGGINGGYLLAVIGNAVRTLLLERGHVDPFSVSAHYLSASVPGPAVVETEVVRAGGRFGCYVRGLWHVLRHSRDYDVVIDSQNGVPFWSPLVARTPVLNLVHHVHKDQWASIFGPRLGRFGWLLESRLAPFVYRNSPYLTVSQATRTELAALGIDPSRVRVVYSGNDVPADLDRWIADAVD